MESKVSIDDLNLVSSSDKPFELDLLSPKTDKPMGITILVFGDHAEKVQKYVRTELNARRQQAALRMKKGKDIDIESVEDDLEFSIESCVVRTAGWKGLKEEFSPELARKLYTQNPALRGQVLAASGNVANFTKL